MGFWDTGSSSVLTALHLQIKSLPFKWLLLGHCVTCATWHQDIKTHFLLHYWVCWLNGFGGGSTAALLLMNPKEANVSIFVSNMVGIFWTLTWWAVNYAPFVHPYAMQLAQTLPMRVFSKSCTQIMRALVIMDRVDSSVRMFPSVIAAPLIVGTIAGCGGKFIAEMIRGGLHLPLGKLEILEPGHSWRSAFLGAGAHYFLSHYFGVLTERESAALVITFMTGHTVMAELFGSPLDYSFPVFRALTVASNVPMLELTPAVCKPSDGPAADKSKQDKAEGKDEKSVAHIKANARAKGVDRSKKQS